MDNSKLLNKFSLFSALDSGVTKGILELSQIKNYKKGKILFIQEDDIYFFYLILSGTVKRYTETVNGYQSGVVLLSAGDSIGEECIFDKTSSSYSAQLVEDTQIIEIPIEAIREASKNSPELALAIANLISEQLRKLQQQMEHLVEMGSSQRVGCFLLKLCGKQQEGSITVKLPYNKALVAAELSMTPETFSRSLQQLKKKKVHVSGNEITINDISELRNNVCINCSALDETCPAGKMIRSEYSDDSKSLFG
jgi:CRP-like cAMP-binding protein